MVWNERRSVSNVIVRARKWATIASGGVWARTASNSGATLGFDGPDCTRPASLYFAGVGDVVEEDHAVGDDERTQGEKCGNGRCPRHTRPPCGRPGAEPGAGGDESDGGEVHDHGVIWNQ